MGAQISCSKERYHNIKSKAALHRYFKKDAEQSTLMVINFTTAWCQPCKEAEAPMKELAEKFKDVKFARVDLDILPPDVVKDFELKTMPTFLLLKRAEDGVDRGDNRDLKKSTSVKDGDGVKGKGAPGAKQDKSLTSTVEVRSVTGVKEGASATEGKSVATVKEGRDTVPSATSIKEGGSNGGSSSTEGKSATGVKEGNIKGSDTIPSAIGIKEGNSGRGSSATEGKSATSVKEGTSGRVPSSTEGKSATSVKEDNSGRVPSDAEGVRATNFKEGSNAIPSAAKAKRSTSVKGGNSAAASATNGESAATGAKEVERTASAMNGENATSAKEGDGAPTDVNKINGMKNGDGVTKRIVKRTMKVGESDPLNIHEFYRMEGPLRMDELTKEIEEHKKQHQVILH